MNPITYKEIQDIAVRCVTSFLNNDVPLSVGLAKEAAEASLSPEQLKRAVEATNTLTHLKMLAIGTDRTVEFPVADYSEVIKLAATPDPLTKSASVSVKTESQAPATNHQPTEAPAATKGALLIKTASILARSADDMAGELTVCKDQILRKCASLKSLSDLPMAMSAVLNESEFTKVASFLGVSDSFVDYAKDIDYKSPGTQQVKDLVALVKQAGDLTAKINEVTSALERLQNAEAGLQKEAGLASMAAALVPKIRSYSTTLTPIKDTVAKYTEKTVGLATKPIKAAGSAAMTSAAIKNKKLFNAAANSKVGQAIGLQPSPLTAAERLHSIKMKRRLGAAATLGAAGVDAAFYPKQDYDIWSSLQG